MSPRQRRISDLLAARQRIDAELQRIGYGIEDLIAEDDMPKARATVDRWAVMARRLVWDGHTHAEVAAELGLPTPAVAALVMHRVKGRAAA